MPDFSGAYTSSETWTTRGTPDQVIARVASALGLATTTPDRIEGAIGSRTAMRLLGVLIPTGKIPLRVNIAAAPADAGTRLVVEAGSNQGWYAASFANRIYERGFRALFARLRELAPPD